LYVGQYNPVLVLLSVAIAVASAYGALAASHRMVRTQAQVDRAIWQAVAALTLTLGAWAMHFIGMLALILPCGVRYDTWTTLLSALPMLLASLAALHGLSAQQARDHLGRSALLLGAGVGAMHYIGMAAMAIEGDVRFQPVWVALSVAVAVALSYVALWAHEVLRCRRAACGLLVACLLGAAMAITHYVAMAAAYFVAGAGAEIPPSALSNTSLAWLIAGVTMPVVLLTLAAVTLSKNWEIAQQLRVSESRWRFALEGSGDGVWEADWAQGTLWLTPKARQIFGAPAGEGEHLPLALWDELLDPQPLGAAATLAAFATSGESHYRALQHRRNAAADAGWVEVHGMVLSRGVLGGVMRLIGTVRDVSQRQRDQQRLQLAASVFTHAREGIMITDAQGLIVDVNDTFSRLTGYTRDEVVGQNPRILSSGRQGAAYYDAMWRTLAEHGHWDGELWNRRKDGQLFAEMLSVSVVRSASGEVQNYVALFSDITAMKSHQQQLEHIAHFDALTGLPNRVLLADRLGQAMAQAQRRNRLLAVLYLDLDGFKAVNDAHGHDAGDELLRTLAVRMRDSLREGDTLARMGGDEFVAVLADLQQATDCEPLLWRLLQAAAQPVDLASAVQGGENLLLQVSVSIGVTIYPLDAADADLLLRHADQAMYAAKQSGKNQFAMFDVALDVARTQQVQGRNRLRQALEAGELVLHYQPKVNMVSGAVTGAEALIRWQHPQQGLLMPASFLPMAQDLGLRLSLGEWVLARALAQMADWMRQGLCLPVSVNLDAAQLLQPGFAVRLAELLAGAPEVPPHCLELEVLESGALEDTAQVNAAMLACQELGVRFALDDFGTGYSSLAYLRHLPAQTLKIDQSFVRHMQDDSSDRAIVGGIIGLARAFDREVIAEGVETRALGDLLVDMGCALAQGYGIARPMPAQDMLTWVVRWRQQAAWTA
jgi:diguanylate cyclase (GGDEF)-like protein/PAS domain S-box-containing protein